jgi:transposase
VALEPVAVRPDGYDISKDHLDVHRLRGGTAARFSNDALGFDAFRGWLGRACPAVVVYEATGAYHAAFERRLGAVLPLCKVNPLQARRFAQAQGTRAKTDTVDARVLAAMGGALRLEPDKPKSETAFDLKELRVEREALVRERTALLTRLKTLKLGVTLRLGRLRLRLVERQLALIEAEIAARIAADKTLARTKEILCSIPGLGAVGSAAVLIEMPEIGTLSAKRCASLAGLAPMARESGRWRGQAHIQGGRHSLRHALYMPALSACRHNPDLARKYQALRDKGKPAKLALTAIMRSLLELANALVKADRVWTQAAP